MVTSLPSAAQRKSSMRAFPFSSASRVGTDCVKGTPANVSAPCSMTADDRTRSSAKASASAVMVTEAVPSML